MSDLSDSADNAWRLELPRQGDMLRDVLDRLEASRGKDYVRIVTLAENLMRSFNKLADPQWSAIVHAFFSPQNATRPPPQNGTTTTPACCLGSDACLQTPIPESEACADFHACLQDDLPGPTCSATNGNELPCHCHKAYEEALLNMDAGEQGEKGGGEPPCGDCLDDASSCDCLVETWLMQYALSRRPCWCSGICAKALFPYLCKIEPVCSASDPKDCLLQLDWCPRSHELLCSKCHLSPPLLQTADGHC